MSMTMRQAFEHWFSSEGKYPRAVEKERGEYILMQTAQAWKAWRAACEWSQAEEAERSGP